MIGFIWTYFLWHMNSVAQFPMFECHEFDGTYISKFCYSVLKWVSSNQIDIDHNNTYTTQRAQQRTYIDVILPERFALLHSRWFIYNTEIAAYKVTNTMNCKSTHISNSSTYKATTMATFVLLMAQRLVKYTFPLLFSHKMAYSCYLKKP